MNMEWQALKLAPEALRGTSAPAKITSRAPILGLRELCDLAEQDSNDLEGLDLINFAAPPDIILKSVGIPTDVVDSDFGDLTVPDLPQLGSFDLIGQLKSMLRRVTARYELRVMNSWNIRIYVRCLEIHSPPSAGSVARLVRETKTSQEGTLSLSIFGMGGGGGERTTLSLTAAMEARDGRCYGIDVPLDLSIDECQYVRDRETFPSFLRAYATFRSSELRQTLVHAPCGRCHLPVSELRKAPGFFLRWYDLSQTRESEATEISLGIEEREGSRAVLEIEPSVLPMKVSLVGQVETLESIRYDYKLPGGSKYYVYRPSGPFSYCWGVER
jgi:hypothetical protein